MTALLLFFLHLLSSFFFRLWSNGTSKEEIEVTKRYIKELTVETRKFQANSAFVTLALIKREIDAQEKKLSTLKENSVSSSPTQLLKKNIIDRLILAVMSAGIVYMYWNVPIFHFPVDSPSLIHRSTLLDVYSTSTYSFDFQSPLWLLTPLSFPSWPTGIVGVVSWTFICHSVSGLL